MQIPFCSMYKATETHIWHNTVSSDAYPFCWINMYKDRKIILSTTEIIMLGFGITWMDIKELHGLHVLIIFLQNQSEMLFWS